MCYCRLPVSKSNMRNIILSTHPVIVKNIIFFKFTCNITLTLPLLMDPGIVL